MRAYRNESQLVLPGIPQPVEPLNNFFFAAQPDKATGQRILSCGQQLHVQHRLSATLFARERLHASLVGLGRYAHVPYKYLAVANHAAMSIALPPFEITFNRAVSFKRGNSEAKSPLVLVGDQVKGLHDLRKAQLEAMQQVGFRFKPATFLPHITLLYDKHRIAEQPIEPIHWMVSEFVLIHSHIGQHRYTQLKRYPLLKPRHQS
jgi:2'-5' RNA ligase